MKYFLLMIIPAFLMASPECLKEKIDNQSYFIIKNMMEINNYNDTDDYQYHMGKLDGLYEALSCFD